MRILPYPRDPRYRVSDQGDVYGVRGQVLRGHLCRKKAGGPLYRALYIAGKTRYVHAVMLETFRGPRPQGLCRRHKNGDSLDNRLSNLEYSTWSKNNHDRVKHGRHPNANKTECIRGHRFTPETTYINATSGSRQCRICQNTHSRNWKRAARQRRKALQHS